MADLKVSTCSMDNTLYIMQEKINEMDTILKSMYESIAELNLTWEGPNHMKFSKQFEKYYEEMQQDNKKLEEYFGVLKEVRELFEQCNAEVKTIVGRV